MKNNDNKTQPEKVITFKNIERERQIKQFYDETRKWDYDKYRRQWNLREKNGRIIQLIYILSFIFMSVSIIFIPSQIYKEFYLYTELEIRNNVLNQVVKEKCYQNNQTLVTFEIINIQEDYKPSYVYVHCDKESFVMGDKW